MRLRKVEISEGEDGNGTMVVTAVAAGYEDEPVTFTFTGRLSFGFTTREYGYVHVDASITPLQTPPPSVPRKAESVEAEKHNSPTSKFT